MNRKLEKLPADPERKTFVITYWLKWVNQTVNVALFTGTKAEVVEMIGWLNYGKTYDKNDDTQDGYYHWDDPPDLVTETGIRNRRDELIKNGRF